MFYRILFLLVGVFGVVGAEESVCGVSTALERYKIYNPNRIFGGENSNEGDFPWYIWMFTDGSGCSGAIIHERWVITAAHCVYNTKTVEVFYGSVNWTIMKTHKIMGLKSFVHPDYNTVDGSDIALVELDGKIEFNENVQPVCLDSSVDPYPDEILTICGMGSDFKKRDGRNITFFSHNILQDAPIQFINNLKCGGEKKICAGNVNHVGLPGDSGNPIMAIRNNRWVQIGVGSAFGWDGFEDESLSITVTDYYIKVSYYCDWIKETTNNEVQC